MTDRTNLADFIAANGITMTVESVSENPGMAGSRHMDNWLCTLRLKYHRRALRVPFSMGSAHNGREPTAAEVLDCLASDAAGFENARQELTEWAHEYGYNLDAEDLTATRKVFNNVRRQSHQLGKWLATTDYETLLWNTERE